MQSSLDRAKFRSGGRRFYVCFSVGAARCRARQGAATGEKHKSKQRKTSVPDVESRLVGKSSTKDADCSRRAAPGRTTRRARRRSLRRTRRHRRRLHWQPLTKQRRKTNTKESVWTLTKHIIGIRHEKLCKMMWLVGRWVPSIARTTEIRVRIVVVVAPSAGG